MANKRKDKYKKLEDFLKAGKWKEADLETGRIILELAKRKQQGWLNNDSIKNVPCWELQTIDQLWVKHSNGSFGFSIQKKIFEDLREKFLDNPEEQGRGLTSRTNLTLSQIFSLQHDFWLKVGWYALGSTSGREREDIWRLASRFKPNESPKPKGLLPSYGLLPGDISWYIIASLDKKTMPRRIVFIQVGKGGISDFVLLWQGIDVSPSKESSGNNGDENKNEIPVSPSEESSGNNGDENKNEIEQKGFLYYVDYCFM